VEFYATILIEAGPTLPMQCLEELVFTPTVKDILVRYVDGMMSVLFILCTIPQNLIRHAAQHAQSMMTWQGVRGPKLRIPWPEQIHPISERLSVGCFPFLSHHSLSIATIVPVDIRTRFSVFP
jgi:hypothetical protein